MEKVEDEEKVKEEAKMAAGEHHVYGGGGPFGAGGSLVHSFINPQPITRASIERYNPRIVDPYRGRRETDPIFVIYGPKPPGGTAIGTLYEKERRDPTKPRRRYLGKVGVGRGLFVNDPRTYRTLTKAEMNYEAILEKLGYDLYQELGRGIFEVPKSYLSQQRIIDPYTRTNRLALFLAGTAEDIASQGLPPSEAPPLDQLISNESLRIMCRMVEGYQDFEQGRTQEERTEESFIAHIERTHRPPEHLLTPDGRLVPIRGLIGLIAVARILADTDVLGGTGGNAGFVWIRDTTGQIIAAQAVKIDPGMAFQFEGHAGLNWADNTYRRTGVRTLTDIRDLQVANNNDLITLSWEALTPPQKTEFLQVLYNSSRYLNSPDILDYLFYREGRFTRSETEENPREIAIRFKEQMERWLNIQLEIYQEELREFKERYQVQIACTQHIDQWGEFLIQQQKEMVERAMLPLRQELDRKEQRLQATEASLVDCLRNLTLSQQQVGAMREALQMTRGDLQQVREESDRKISDLMRRMKAIESRPAIEYIGAGASSSSGDTATQTGSPLRITPVFSPSVRTAAATSSTPMSSVTFTAPAKPALAFGAAEWSRYFGDVGVEPPLPPNIDEILASRCPFQAPGIEKTVGETHMLVLVPAKVGGQPYTLDSLSQMIQVPQSGGHKTQYQSYSSLVKAQEGSKAPDRPYWVLMTRDVLPGTRNKKYEEQLPVLERLAQGNPLMAGRVSAPTGLEAATALLMEHVRTGRRLYTDSPWTYTFCQEVVSGYHVTVGGFSLAGLGVSYVNHDEADGLASLWKFF